MLPARSIAVSAAVVCFFAVGIVGSVSGLAPYTCCKRALLGAAIAYLAAGTAVQAVMAILTQAIVASHTNKDKEQVGDIED